ncbi:uncharacterized protein LOC111294625 [Durio zibethinus]|uniref:Uncharacterized protein LOC111294625 n=1 Tax=Durio zibethinus TaxID=66656 RepID=A0A6P5YU85_DURZI|nr:uncharacterized protein LOC111294625 [Durio zibethinus]
MPRQVLQSPFHPQHILFPRPIPKGPSYTCSACKEEVKGIGFYCNQCDVTVHVSCAKYQTRAIKHDCHPHQLLHLGKSILSKISCNACHQDCDDSFFGCIKCDFYIHVECIPLPPSVEHRRHLHPLVLKNSFVEDDSEDYYCDMCETERNPEHDIYFCEECAYIAHIDCVHPEVKPTEEMFLDQRTKKNSDKAEIIDKMMELEEILVHNGKEIQKNAFHPHPLALNDNDPETIFVCNGCGELCRGLSYNCNLCLFSLESKCAALNDDLAKHKALKGREIQTTIYHFGHNHQLTRCKINRLQTEFHLSCMACRQDLYGLVYTCPGCAFFLHESCLKDMLREVESPLHPQHPLLLHPPLSGLDYPHCNFCRERNDCIAYICFGCNFFLHYSCAKYQTRKMKHNCHIHDLLHLGKSIFVKTPPQCATCHTDCNDTLFGCIECEFYIHLECISLPYIVKHMRHLHSLTLTNSVVENNSGEHYCDICETERNPEHDVYYCKECTYIAHIDCVISEVEPPEKIFEYLKKRRLTKRGRIDERCSACKEEVKGISFYCNQCDVNMHVSCTKYRTRAIKHNCHPHHLLHLGKSIISNISCDACYKDCDDSFFGCIKCDFYIDVEYDSGDYYCDMCETERNAEHHVYFCKECTYIAPIDCVLPEVEPTEEMFSNQRTGRNFDKAEIANKRMELEGILVHDEKDMLIEVESPFHPQHPLLPFPLRTVMDNPTCKACHDRIDCIMFGCYECNLYMHYSCAKYQTRMIKHNCHVHHLLHLGKSIFVKRSPPCAECRADCNNTFFGCMKCEFYIHLECIQLPYIIKHMRHLHPLTLTNSVVEDNSGIYYCDICETERNPEHDVYYCKECTYIAHINCVISVVEPPEEISKYLVPRPRKEKEKADKLREILKRKMRS